MVVKLYEQDELNPVNLELALGLVRGSINSITIYPTGAVEIDFSITPSTTLDNRVQAELVRRGYPRGRRPEL